MTITRWLACLLLTATAGSAAAQTLGDVARAEQERRKAVSKAGKVYTNESLKPEPLPSPPPASLVAGSLSALASGAPPSTPAGSPASGTSSGTVPAVPASAATASGVPTTEAGWRARMAELRGNVLRQQVLADALQSRVNAALLDFVNRDNPVERAVIESDRNRALAELDRVQKDMKAAQQAVGEMEEQARRLNVPPGWLR